MAAEQAQHLIAMSLGKIAASRNQRGGANLHRSLLVSTVLHKARTTIMMENFQAMMQQRRAQMEAQQQRVDVAEDRPDTPAPTALPQDGPDKENSIPGCSAAAAARLSADKEADNNNNNSSAPKPSPLQASNTTTNTQTTPNCARCLKRRVCELGPGDSDLDDVKRAKMEADAELSHDSSSRADCAFDSENVDYSDSTNTNTPSTATEQPMQTESVQITSLVHRFNSGLSGLLTQVANEQHHGQCSEQAFTSCCTQVVKDGGMDSLSRPCIALTV